MTLNLVVLNSRTVSLGELQSGKLVNSRMMLIRFTEQKTSVPSMIAKVKDTLQQTTPDTTEWKFWTWKEQEVLHLNNFI